MNTVQAFIAKYSVKIHEENSKEINAYICKSDKIFVSIYTNLNKTLG
jgi:hypothetical protein